MSPPRSAIICRIAAGSAASRCSTKCACRTASTTRWRTARRAASPIGPRAACGASTARIGATDDRALQSQLFLPAGAEGPALLLHPNFAVIRRYNNSDRYALVVALLARAFDGRSAGWCATGRARRLAQPRADARIADAAERLRLRRRQRRRLFGSGTRRAVRAFQADQRPGRRRLSDRGAARSRARARRRHARAGARAARAAARRHPRIAAPAQSPWLRRRPRGRRHRLAHPRRRSAPSNARRGMEVRGRATDVVLEAARAAAG